MKRRNFIQNAVGFTAASLGSRALAQQDRLGDRELTADVAVIGASLGGCAAALTLLRKGYRVILTEETDWVGGQLTSQGVPPDEHRWIETHGSTKSYRDLRTAIRDHYRRFHPLTAAAKADSKLNPGRGSVSRLCHEPRVALAVLEQWLTPYQAAGKLTFMPKHRPVDAEVEGDRVISVTVKSLTTGNERVIQAPFFVDASELGDLLPLTKTEYVCGAEGKQATGEWHMPDEPDPSNQQAFTMCFAISHHPGEDHVIDQPANYGFWRDHVPRLTPPWPGKLLDWTYTHPRSGEPRKLGFNPVGDRHDGVVNLWTYRRIAAVESFRPGTYQSDISLVNWPQNDFMLGPIVDVPEEAIRHRVAQAKELSLSLLYWMQTDAPRLDGGTGYPGMRLRPDVMGTDDGLAKYPYVRESRRLVAETMILEAHCGREQRAALLGIKPEDVAAERYEDSVGVGSYPIDLHPSCAGDNYIDFETAPFEVPLGALLPHRVENLIAACKNIGSTHVTNGCYRLHPVEWGIGEAAGQVLAEALRDRTNPKAIRRDKKRLEAFQDRILREGVEIRWPNA